MWATIILFTALFAFLAIIAWAFWPSAKSKFETLGADILIDDDSQANK